MQVHIATGRWQH